MTTFVFSGSSDPYVKFKLAGKEVFRSKTIHKNLNPVWDEKVTLIMDSLSEPLYVKVTTHTQQTHTHKAFPSQFLMNRRSGDFFCSSLGVWLRLRPSRWLHGLCLSILGVSRAAEVGYWMSLLLILMPPCGIMNVFHGRWISLSQIKLLFSVALLSCGH